MTRAEGERPGVGERFVGRQAAVATVGLADPDQEVVARLGRHGLATVRADLKVVHERVGGEVVHFAQAERLQRVGGRVRDGTGIHR